MRKFCIALCSLLSSSASSTKLKVFCSVSTFVTERPSMKLHTVCRNSSYTCGTQSVERYPVRDEQVPWSVEYPSYDPPTFTMKNLSTKPWADPEIGTPGFEPKWNTLDGNVDRRSHMGAYDVASGYPRNPVGRTGLRGRGRLGRWGPNHAADPIVSRWKRDSKGSLIHHVSTQQPILQFVAIKRQDCGQWAIPGGMIDPGEMVSTTLRREFCEEAMNSFSLSEDDKKKLEMSVSEFFNSGKVVYEGYVDDPRNTDNAWMETVACSFHDDAGTVVGRFPLEAGDDACQVRWTDFSLQLDLYANHVDLLKHVAVMLNAHC